MTLKTVRALALLPAPPFRSVVTTPEEQAEWDGCVYARRIENKRGENVLELANVPDTVTGARDKSIPDTESEFRRIDEARATFVAFAKVPELIAALDGMLATIDSGTNDHVRAIEYARCVLDETITAMMPEGAA